VAETKYKRVLLKISGEGLCKSGAAGLDGEEIRRLAEEIKLVVELGVQVAVVVGGGNIVRGSVIAKDSPIEETTGHYMGMLATVINALALQDRLEQQGLFTRVMSAINMEEVAEPYIRRRAIRHLEEGRIVIMAAGTGNPYFTTDTAAVLRAAEVHAEIILMAKQGIDGVYSADPNSDPGAKRYSQLSYEEALVKNLRVMDQTALALCRENQLPIVVFNMEEVGNLRKLAAGKAVGTRVEG